MKTLGSRRVLIRLVLTCLLLTFVLRAEDESDGGQSSLKDLSLEQLGNVEVTTVSKKPVAVSRTAAAIYVITQEDIRRSGVTLLPEALRLAPGVEVARIDSSKWAIGIRGFQSRLSRSVLVMIDGRTVYSPMFHGVYWEVQDTMLEDVDRIEVIRGPGGTIWGANAVNGVINIITKSSKDTQGALVTAGGGSVNQGFLNARYGGGNGKNFTYRVYAKGMDRAPEYHFNNQQFDDWRRMQGGFRTDWDVTQRDALTVQGDLYSSSDGESVRIATLTAPFAYIAQQNASLSGGNVLARWRRTLSSTSNFQLQLYYDRVDRREPNQAEVRNTFDVDFVHHLRLPARQDLTWGLGARISLGDLPTVVPTFTFTPTTRTDQLYSAFLQDEIPLVGEKLSLTFGTKHLHSSFTGFDFEPSARLLWTPGARQSFWTAITRAVRTPSDLEDTQQIITLRSSSPLAFNRQTGDQSFSSEIMYGYEIGYRRIVKRNISVDFAGFRNHYNNLLSLEPGTPFLQNSPGLQYLVYPLFNRNGITGNSTGFEIVPDWKPREWWRLQASYAYLQMTMQNRTGSLDVSTVRSLEGSSPRHDVTIQSYVDLWHNIEFSQIYRFVSALPALGVPSYSTIDARIGFPLSRNVQFSVVAQNLLQPHHVEFNGDPGGLVGIKRNVYASVTWRK